MKIKSLLFINIFMVLSLFFVGCSSNNVIHQLEKKGYLVEKQDVSYCDSGIINHYIVYEGENNIGYIYEFEDMISLDQFKQDNSHINQTQIKETYIIFLEDDLLDKLE